MLRKADIILIAVVLAVVGASFVGIRLYDNFRPDYRKIAVIMQNDRVIKRIDLDAVKEPERIDVSNDFYQIVLLENGRIRFQEAECPDLICVKTGWLTKKGDIAVCLPSRTIIKIEGEPEDLDGITS